MAPLDEYRRRVERARELMSRRTIAALIVTDAVSYFYFSGHQAPVHKSRPSIMIIPLDGEPVLITCELVDTLAKIDGVPFPSWVKDRRFYPEVPFSKDQPTDWGIRSALAEMKADAHTIGIELGQDTRLELPVNDFMKLKNELPRAKFVDSGPIIWGCRMIKSEWEIDTIRKTCEIGGRAYERTFETVKEGMTSRQIKEMMFRYYVDGGADLVYSGGFARGAKGPGETFQKGNVLYIDGGPSYKGYMMDFTRRGVFGQPSERQKWEHKTAWEILRKVMDILGPGTKVSDAFNLANEELKKVGLEKVSYSNHPAKRLGHGTGLESEPPSFNAIDQTVLQKGMVVTPEPKFTSVDGFVNPEEQILITENGYELLSKIPDPELRILG